MHGLTDDRLRIKVDGMDLVSACANHMNPALSHIDPTAVDSVTVFGGIAGERRWRQHRRRHRGGNCRRCSQQPGQRHGGLRSGRGLLPQQRQWSLAQCLGNHWPASLSLRYTGASARADNYDAAGDFKTSLVPTTTVRLLGSREAGSSQYQSNNRNIDLGATPTTCCRHRWATR